MRLTIELSDESTTPQVTVGTPQEMQQIQPVQQVQPGQVVGAAAAAVPTYDGGADRGSGMASVTSQAAGTPATTLVTGDGAYDGGPAPTGRPSQPVEPPLQIEQPTRDAATPM